MPTLAISRRTDRYPIRQGPFVIARIMPGLPLHLPGDHGLGPLGLVDHATLQPGVVVRMHEHCNDEILSYLRQGSLIHEDTSHRREILSPKHLMMMNAGRGISHEESVPGAGVPVEMLQIFMRPREANLPPAVQFHWFDESYSVNGWRLVGGPETASAPLTIRNDVWFYDTRLHQSILALPPLLEMTGWLYVFGGDSVQILEADLTLGVGDALIVEEQALTVITKGQSDLVFFRVNRSAAYSRSGTLSG